MRLPRYLSQNRPRLCKNSEAHPYVGVEREQRHSILELDDQFFDFSHRLDRFYDGRPPMTFSRHYLAQQAALDAVDLAEVQGCPRAHNQLGFAYQVGFVRLLNSCLTLIVACIIYWQAKDISRVIGV